MKISLSFRDYDEVVQLCKASVDAHPENIVLTIDGMHADVPQPRHRKALCDDELTVDELCYYESGRLHVYNCILKSGVYKLEDIAEVMQLDIEMLSMILPLWDNGEIVQRGAAMYQMIMRNAERDMRKEKMM